MSTVMVCRNTQAHTQGRSLSLIISWCAGLDAENITDQENTIPSSVIVSQQGYEVLQLLLVEERVDIAIHNDWLSSFLTFSLWPV